MSDRLTAMDVASRDFQRKMRGFDPDEVKMYLTAVSEEVERLNLENAEFKEDVGRQRQEIDEFRSREKTLQDTLVAAQRMSDELGDKARAEADLVVKEAKIKAERLLQQTQDQLVRLEDEIGRCKLERDAFENRLRSSLGQHLELLDLRKQERGEPESRRVLRSVTGSEAG